MSQSTRPSRPSVVDELGHPKSLLSGPEQFACLGGGDEALFLGLGPDPGLCAEISKEYRKVSYIEHPDFALAMPSGWADSIPSHFEPTSLAQAGRAFQGTVFLYVPNLKLFPSFWGPAWAAARLAGHASAAQGPESTVLLVASDERLLGREIREALESLGLDVLCLDPAEVEHKLPFVLRQFRPSLFLCINFEGMDPQGLNFHLLRQAGIPVAVWLVDNPFHVLSGVKAPYWREVNLLVTDDWFLEPLKRHGARRVAHLPLGASPSFAGRAKQTSGLKLADRLVFVGRSQFPGKQGFFAAEKMSTEERGQARSLMLGGKRTDFAFWLEHHGINQLWPGNDSRGPGYAAEESSRFWRACCLARAASRGRLTVFGDQGWRDFLPESVDLREEVDYYGRLAEIYAQSGFSLNLTSLLLPHGLTQRHFDVWSAGGFLVSDATPGLKLFPAELCEPISFSRPDEIGQLLNKLENSPDLVKDLKYAWQKLILSEHTYRARLAWLLDWLKIGQESKENP